MTPRIPVTSLPGVRQLIANALREDIGSGDATTIALVPEGAWVSASILARQVCVVSGTDVARAVFRKVDRRLKCITRIPDGGIAKANDAVMTIAGPARGILTAERTALNFIQRMSGIATLTRSFVEKVGKTRLRILDTRKTTPCLRVLEKYAVRCGGGENHRMGLYDRILIKDNHRRFWTGASDAATLDAAVREARRQFPSLDVEVEVESESELRSVLKESPEWVLLDNMSPVQLRRCVRICAGRAKLEASGGITAATIADVAASGVDAVSLGCLTHSAPAVDLSLEIDPS